MVAHADGGTMLQFIKDQPKGRLSEEVAANFAMQMTLGLQYLHDVAKVIHRDIHAENILLDKGVLKIADFGCCVQDDSRVRTTMCGTLDYLAPERLTGRSYDYRVDLWALGVLVTEFLIGKATFQAGEDDCVVVRILNLELRFPSYLSKDARGLIQKLLRLDPDRLPLDKVRYLILIIYVGKVVWYLSLDGIGILVRYGTLPTSNGAALVFPLNSEAQKRVPETQGVDPVHFWPDPVN